MADVNHLSYGLLATGQITSGTDTTTVYGNVGTNLGVTGTSSIVHSGYQYIGPSITPALINAQNAYIDLIGLTPDSTLGDANIGGMTFTPGIWRLTNSDLVIGGSIPENTITLDGTGQYTFQVFNGGLTTDPTLGRVTFNLINGSQASSVFWLVSGNVNLQTLNLNITSFHGTIISQQNITLGPGSKSYGSLIAMQDITVNANSVWSQVNQVLADTGIKNDINLTTSLYLNLASSLADSQAVKISATDANGGIKMQAGFSGIELSTTNAINLNAEAASSFVTSIGNLEFQSAVGLVNIDAGSGINIGNDVAQTPTAPAITTPIINIGSSSTVKQVTIGNTTGSTSLALLSGTGGITANAGGTISLTSTGASSNFTLNSTAAGQDLTLAVLGSNAARAVVSSQGTGLDSIFLNTSAGGMVSSIAGPINFVTFNPSGAAINFDSSSNNGGISVLSGNQGIVLNTVNGTIGIGNFAPSTILLGNVGSNMIVIGNTSSGSTVFARSGSGGWYNHQSEPISLGDADATLTMSQLLAGIILMIPSTNRTLTLPSAASVVATHFGIVVDDSVSFSLINKGVTSVSISLTSGSGGSVEGNPGIVGESSGLFRLRITNTGVGTESYVVYRLS